MIKHVLNLIGLITIANQAMSAPLTPGEIRFGVEVVAARQYGTYTFDSEDLGVAASHFEKLHPGAKEKGWSIHGDNAVLVFDTPLLTLDQAIESKEIESVFKVIDQMGVKSEVKPGGPRSGGSVRIGREIFDRNPLLLRNFIVEYYNNPFIQSVFSQYGDDTAYSPVELQRHAQLVSSLREIESGELTIKNVVGHVFHASGCGQNVALNLNDLYYDNADKAALEIRSFRVSRTAQQFRNRLRFLAAMLMRLDRIKSLLPLREFDHWSWIEEASPQAARKKFAAYVTELGLNPANYADEWNEKFRPVVTLADGEAIYEVRLVRVFDAKFESKHTSFKPARESMGTYEISIYTAKQPPSLFLRYVHDTGAFDTKYLPDLKPVESVSDDPLGRRHWVMHFDLPERYFAPDSEGKMKAWFFYFNGGRHQNVLKPITYCEKSLVSPDGQL